MSDQTPQTETPKATAGSRQSTWKRMRFLVGLGIVVAGFWLVVMSGVESGTYFFTVDEAMAHHDLEDRRVRVKGIVVEGTYQNPEGTRLHRFDITENGKVMSVRYEGPIPDVFKEGIEVVAEGRLNGRTLTAQEIVAKCPSKYEEGQVPEEMQRYLEQTRGS